MVKFITDFKEKKRKRGNKNKKKAWRKTDITNVEAELEEKRRDERIGGILEEGKVEDILFLDTGCKGSKPHQKKQDIFLEYMIDTVPGGTPGGFKKSRKNRTPILRCHQFLNGLPGAKPPVKSKANTNGLPTAQKRKSELEARNPKTAVKYAKWKSHLEYTTKKENKKIAMKEKNKYLYDLWNEEGDTIKYCQETGIDESFAPGIAKYYETQTKTLTVRKPQFDIPSTLPAIRKPHEGASYNPTFVGHQELMNKAVAIEEAKLRKTQHYNRLTIKMFPKASEAPTEATWMKEMSEGLPTEEQEESSEDEDEVSEDKVTVTKKGLNERKTKKQRKKERIQKQMAEKIQKKKVDRIRESDFHRIKTFQKEIRIQEEEEQKRIIHNIANKKYKRGKKKRLSAYEFEDEDVVVSFGSELTDSLRTLKPSGSILEDRYKTLQRRNIIETRVRQKVKKKVNVKKQVKQEHKEELEKMEKIAYAQDDDIDTL